MTKMIRDLLTFGRSLTRHLPEHPYPSDHPWKVHHDPERPRG
ncbi:MAG: hypothetical protein ABW073_03155 [Acidimicrobiia bacterium]